MNFYTTSYTNEKGKNAYQPTNFKNSRGNGDKGQDAPEGNKALENVESLTGSLWAFTWYFEWSNC